MAETRTVSFCATNLNTVSTLDSSLRSVDEIGRRIGGRFEVVVADGPSSDGATELLRRWVERAPGRIVVQHDQRNRGYGRRRAFEASHGDLVVPFDTSLAYDPVYGDLLRAYRDLQTDRMLFSEVCGLSRRSIEDVGGWRNLVGGEDVDLYARVVLRHGLIAYPTALRTTQAARLGSYERQMRYMPGSRSERLRRMYEVQRDQIIAGNYAIADLMAFNALKPPLRRAGLWLFYQACALGARRQSIRPFRAAVNNYLVVREAILRSLVEGGPREVGWSGPPPQLLLTRDEIAHLERRSSYYRALDPPSKGLVAVK